MIPDYAQLARMRASTPIGVPAGELLRLLAAFHAVRDERAAMGSGGDVVREARASVGQAGR